MNAATVHVEYDTQYEAGVWMDVTGKGGVVWMV